MLRAIATIVVLTAALFMASCEAQEAGPGVAASPQAEAPAETPVEAEDPKVSVSSDAPTPVTTVDEAIALVKAYDGPAAEFELPIADSLLDPAGMNMAIIGDELLGKKFLPDGFEQREGYRVYKYKPFD